MVFFSCNNCSEAVKKNQVEKHLYKCRNATVSCMDCQLIFTYETYKGHIKCISENQKYGGKNYVEKENKGEVKQNAWVEQVNNAIENVTDNEVKELLKNIAGYANIPRKEAKFINFLMNSVRLRNRDMAKRAWNAIAAEADKMRQEAIKKQEELQKAQKEAAEEKKKKEEAQKKADEEAQEPVEFKWKKAIKRKLKENGGEMKLKKLRKSIMEDYEKAGGDVNQITNEFIEEKLEKCAVRIDGKNVVL